MVIAHLKSTDGTAKFLVTTILADLLYTLDNSGTAVSHDINGGSLVWFGNHERGNQFPREMHLQEVLAFFSWDTGAWYIWQSMKHKLIPGKRYWALKVRYILTWQQNSGFLSLHIVTPYHASPSFLAIVLCIDVKSREYRTSSYIACSAAHFLTHVSNISITFIFLP